MAARNAIRSGEAAKRRRRRGNDQQRRNQKHADKLHRNRDHSRHENHEDNVRHFSLTLFGGGQIDTDRGLEQRKRQI